MENLYQVTSSIRMYDSDDRCVDSMICQVFCAAPCAASARDLAYHHIKEHMPSGDYSSADVVITDVRLFYSSIFIR